jgi:hypothetical protein
LNFEEFVNKARFYAVQLHQPTKIQRGMRTKSSKFNLMMETKEGSITYLLSSIMVMRSSINP